jgi:signal transduction histidine kinase
MENQSYSSIKKSSTFLLRFNEPLERKYFSNRIEQESSGIRLIFASLAIINPLFILLDFWRLEDPFDPVLTRVVLELIFTSVILIHHRLKKNKIGHQILFFSSSIIIYVFLLISTHISSDYYELFIPNSTTLVLLVNASFIGLRFRHSVILNLFIITIYSCYANWLSPLELHLKQLPFLGIFFIMSSVLSYLFERKSRSVFLKSEFIEDQNKIIEQKNSDLSEENNLKNSLMSILSHDIKSPLSSLQAILELRSDALITNDDAINHFNKVGKSVNSLSEFVSNMILWIKSQMEGFHAKSEVVGVRELVDQVINLCGEQAKKKSISIKNEICNDRIMKFDKEMTSIVIRNLVSNAIKYSHQNGLITIQEHENTTSYEIKIIDSGVGIDEAKISSLFSNVNSSSIGTNKEEGTGLGLMLSYNLMKKMKGKLRCESILGKGSIFTMKFESN